MQLRPFQFELKDGIRKCWSEGNDNVLAVSATGSGKTVLFSSIVKDEPGPSCSIAHRQELVGQMSLSLARFDVRHRIVAPQNIISQIVQNHTRELGRSFYDPTAPAGVAGVDTLVRRSSDAWMNSVKLWVQDEAHHVLKDNKWGTAAKMFPNAKGLGVTATPERSDGKGLGAHHDGLFHSMVEGPPMRWLIENGYLTDYRVFAPPSDLIMDEKDIGSTGDYSGPKMRKKAEKSKIVGDVVNHYLNIAKGKLGVVFATDVKTSEKMVERFNDAGVPAAIVHANTRNRDDIIRRFRNREFMVLVNVDIFGEGFDLPAIEVVIMARPTASFGLYAQQFGRALRIMDGKTVAIIIDHVGNVLRHGLPDRKRIWTLDRKDRSSSRGKDPDLIPTKACLNPLCLSVYEAFHAKCPFCGHVNQPAGRSLPEHVDGDLLELDAATLAAMRGEIERIDSSPHLLGERMAFAGAPKMAINGAMKNHRERQESQDRLRASIALWAGYQRRANRPDSESYRRFFFRYGVDVGTAQTLGKKDADLLCSKIVMDMMDITN